MNPIDAFLFGLAVVNFGVGIVATKREDYLWALAFFAFAGMMVFIGFIGW